MNAARGSRRAGAPDGATSPLPHAPAAEPFIPFASTWSLPSGFGAGDIAPSQNLPREFGRHQVTFQSVDEGYGIFQAGLHFNRQIKITGTVISPRPFLILRMPVAGRAHVGLDGGEVLSETPEGYGLFLHGRVGDQCSIEQSPNESSDLVAPMITADRLRTILAGMRVPAVIEKFIDGCGENFVAAPKMSAVMRQLIGQIRTSPYVGDLSRLHQHGQLFNLLAVVLSDLEDRRNHDRRQSDKANAKVRAVCDLLRSDLGRLPPLETLAGAVGLSQRQLAHAFRASTGLTVLEWVIKQRLEVASQLLAEGSLPIKEISHRAGYAHVPSFSAAFTRQFGVPPAEYRRTLGAHHFVSAG
jgi:AraC-like DNA-binding protein